MGRADGRQATGRKAKRAAPRAREDARRGVAAKGAETSEAPAAPDVVVITGLSGSGMSSATNAFEDLGYFCVDNLPLTLLPTFARLVQPDDGEDDHGKQHIRRAALVIDIREGHFLSEFERQIERLRRGDLKVAVIFFEASDQVLQRRFSETRRPHPYETDDGLAASIRAEREAMADIRAHADLIIDTSEHNIHSLRRYLVERFSPDAAGAAMRVRRVSHDAVQPGTDEPLPFEYGDVDREVSPQRAYRRQRSAVPATSNDSLAAATYGPNARTRP